MIITRKNVTFFRLRGVVQAFLMTTIDKIFRKVSVSHGCNSEGGRCAGMPFLRQHPTTNTVAAVWRSERLRSEPIACCSQHRCGVLHVFELSDDDVHDYAWKSTVRQPMKDVLNTCVICGRKMKVLWSHIDMCHRIGAVRKGRPCPTCTSECPVCQKTVRGLTAHYVAAHGQPSDTTCPLCFETFTTKATLVRHAKQMHIVNVDEWWFDHSNTRVFCIRCRGRSAGEELHISTISEPKKW